MIERLFSKTRPPFITARDGTLHVGEEQYDQLIVQIHQAQPVRKLFVDRKVLCESRDGRTAKRGGFCELCHDRDRCSQRLQLRLTYRTQDQDQDQPAILELSRHHFRAFDACLEQIGDLDQLQNVLIRIKPLTAQSGWTTLTFECLF